MSYFQDKLGMCSHVKVEGEDAVFCIIREMPTDLTANTCATRCATPDELYNKFLNGLEPTRSQVESSKSTHQEVAMRTINVKPTEEQLRCYNCQRLGTHISRDCLETRMDRCRSCGSLEHQKKACPRGKKASRVS